MRRTGKAGRWRTLRLRTVCGPLALGVALTFAACDRDALLSPPDATPPDTPPGPTVPPVVPLGLVEVTISGIGTGQQTATAMPYRPGLAGIGAGATPFGAPVATFDLVPVTNNSALALDGTGDYVTADGVSDALAGAAAYTVEAWIYPQAEAGAQQAVLGFHTSTGDNVTVLFYDPDDDRFSYFIPPGGYGWPPVQYAPGRWHHVALVVDGPDGDRMYINGSAQTSLATTLRPEIGGFFSIGQEYDATTATDFFQGRIDEVRVWNVARTQGELQADMDREIDPATPGLVSYYRFDETSGSTASDIVGDNDGTLHGDAAFGATGPALDGTSNGDGTIQLEPVSTGSFTVGDRGNGGYRYVYSSFRVRNAQTDGTAYGTPRENLTFLGVDTDGTIGHTAVSELAMFSGTEITGASALAIAEATIPTGAAYQRSDGAIQSIEPDVLQALTEVEAAAVDLTGTTATDVFPYGFVVRTSNATPGGRTLPGSPAVDQFDGLVTFAFKVPLQASPAGDPFAIRMVFLPRDDGEVRLTQSLEEQGPDARAAFAARAAALGASSVTLLPGGDYVGTIPFSMVCEPVRVAGPAGGATGSLFPVHPAFLGFTPDPYAGDGSASRIAGTTSISAMFDAAVYGANDATFTVHGAQSGRAFLAQPYTGNGTSTIAAPAGSFSPGEVVEVTLTPQLGYCPAPFGRVARYRVAAGVGPGTFTADTTRFVASGGHSLVTGDLDGDGELDVAAASGDLGRVYVQLQGAGVVEYPAGGSIPQDLVAVDLDGDSDLDLVTANTGSGDVSVFLNDGLGSFAPAVAYDAGAGAGSLASGDFDGDGDLDLAVANLTAGTVSILLNAGDATFTAAGDVPVVVDASMIASGDLDGDGDLDLVVAIPDSNIVAVLVNTGNATFANDVSVAIGGAHPTRLVLADLDADGDLDVAATSDEDLLVLRNAGDGTFPVVDATPVGEDPISIVAADLDGDGDLDLAVPLRLGLISIVENDGDAAFSVNTATSGINNLQAIASGDADGDGDIDLSVVAEDGIVTLLNSH